jgi:hypothetical protein
MRSKLATRLSTLEEKATQDTMRTAPPLLLVHRDGRMYDLDGHAVSKEFVRSHQSAAPNIHISFTDDSGSPSVEAGPEAAEPGHKKTKTNREESKQMKGTDENVVKKASSDPALGSEAAATAQSEKMHPPKMTVADIQQRNAEFWRVMQGSEKLNWKSEAEFEEWESLQRKRLNMVTNLKFLTLMARRAHTFAIRCRYLFAACLVAEALTGERHTLVKPNGDKCVLLRSKRVR